MRLADFHVHTCYCDGKDSPGDIVKEAIRRGMKRLGFSGHSYTAFDTEYCMSLEGTQSYMAEIDSLNEE
ncbi:MAG: PHP domain-containing protein, partial [Synergistaceae bacterium]|nr:PHP domain-containing protein [Synergistaceae bacterium]